ncbi:CYTH domain-containing protein [Candidatus Parcubacteria bacterium]|nr:CYTH domain-containing protein [Candidatus Parcubacteria bacterium]
MKEIEVLIEVKSDKEAALKALEQFDFKGASEVLDIYLTSPLFEKLHPDESGRLNYCYRVRAKDGLATVAYKEDHFSDSGEWIYSDEYETRVEDVKALNEINARLFGLKELVRVNSTKYKYIFNDYEIILEDVVDLGLFLEVEKLTQVQDDKVVETKQEIRDFLKTLPIEFGEEQNAGKPELMLRRKTNEI